MTKLCANINPAEAKRKFFWETIDNINVMQELHDGNFKNLTKEEKIKYVTNYFEHISTNMLVDFNNICVDFRETLLHVVKEYLKELDVDERFKLIKDYTNDDLFDASSFIILLGKSIYYYTLDNPRFIFEIMEKYGFVNFEFMFDYVISDKMLENVEKV